MKRIVMFGVTTALLTLAWSGTAQERERRGPPGAGMSSVQVLVDNAQELGLTAKQIEALGILRGDLQERTAPALEKLRAMRDEGDMRSRRDEVRPLMDELRAANREAEAAALALLGEEQRVSAERVLEAHRRDTRQRMRGRRHGRR